MSDAIDRIKKKVNAIIKEAFSDKADLLNMATNNIAMKKYTAALAPDFDEKDAHELAFHLCDWGWDAAFIIAMHMCPDRFLEDEIEAGVGLFLIHAPNHLAAACRIYGVDMQDIFTDDSE